jgi:hypothetical protein
MTYQHKRIPCSKKTKDIITENFLIVKKTEYDLEEPVRSIDTESTVGKALNNEINTLPNETEEVLSESSGEETQERTPDIEHGQYAPEEETQVEPESTKKSIEKKKGMRNYLESRVDYEQL